MLWKREVCSHGLNPKGEENSAEKSPEFAKALIGITVLHCLWCSESSWGCNCWEDRDRPICYVLGYLCGKQQGYGETVVTSKTWLNGYAIAIMLPLSLLSGVISWKMEDNAGEKAHSPLSVCGGSVLLIQWIAECEQFWVMTLLFCAWRVCLSWFSCSSCYMLFHAFFSCLVTLCLE